MKPMDNKASQFISKSLTALAALLLILLHSFCASLDDRDPLQVFIQHKRENLWKHSLLVLNFQEPDYAKGAGATVAEMFHIQLLKSRKFKVVSLFTLSQWSVLGGNEEERLQLAIEEAQDRGFDYLLVGELKDFYDGGINQSRVDLKIRIIEIKTLITIFLAQCHSQSEGKDTSYPMTTKLTRRSHAPVRLVDEIIRQMLKKM